MAEHRVQNSETHQRLSLTLETVITHQRAQVNLQRGCNACRPCESSRVEAGKEQKNGADADADRSTSHRTLLKVKLLQQAT